MTSTGSSSESQAEESQRVRKKGKQAKKARKARQPKADESSGDEQPLPMNGKNGSGPSKRNHRPRNRD